MKRLHTHATLLLLLLMSTSIVLGCEERSFRDCSAEDATAAETLPDALASTGLFEDIETKEIAAGVVAFEPRFALWTDGAKKRRWILLPEGEPVDTSDADHWSYPVGTKLFKEFSLDGVLLETRMNVKTAAGWTGASYVWNASADRATKTLAGATDILGTSHDVPNAQECLACHRGRENFTLGFSATQLDNDARDSLFSQGLLTHESDVDQRVDPVLLDGLGVLHANCSHCHNADRPTQPLATDCYRPRSDDEGAFDFTLPSELADIYSAPALTTADDLLGTLDESKVLRRMSMRNLDEETPSMPPLGTEIVDDDGVATMEAFVEALASLQ